MRVNEDIGIIGRFWLRIESLVNRNSGVPAPGYPSEGWVSAGRELNPFLLPRRDRGVFLWVILFRAFIFSYSTA